MKQYKNISKTKDSAIRMTKLKIEHLSGSTIVNEEIDKITGKVFVN